MKFSLTALTALFSIALASPVQVLDGLSDDSWTNPHSLADSVIIQRTLNTLKTIQTNATRLDACSKCKNSIEVGKEIALTRPDLIPQIFTQWCTDNKIASAATCQTTYGRNTVKASRTGSDFSNLLQLIDPWSIDGDYLCYYKFNQVCNLPSVNSVNLSSWWPSKEENFKAPETEGEKFNVLHVSDFHIQLDYKLGSEGNCTGNGMCCVDHFWNSKAKPSNIDNSDLKFFDASYDDNHTFHGGNDVTSKVFNASVWDPAQTFGNYRCDSPEVLINSSLKSIVEFQQKENITFDFVLFTGDMIDHDDLEHTNYSMTIESQERIVRDLKSYFKDVPVYSVLGNHDTFPYGQIASKSSGFENLYDWNNDLMAELWIGNDWLGFDQYESIKTHYTGFSVPVKKGLKIVSLNSNTYYQKNYYSYWNMSSIDTFGTAKFLVDELIESESKGEKVWVIAHIPFVDYDTLPIQAEVYKQIMTRFSETVGGLFFGHTHQDQFNVLYAHDNKTVENAILNTWVSQSVTPLSYYNPGWRYYEVAPSFEILNSFNYYTKLNETFSFEQGEEPTWEFEYSARDAYDPEHHWPEEAPLNATFWAQVVEKIKSNITYAQDYASYSYRMSPYAPDCSQGDCKALYCYVSSFNINENNHCNVTVSYKS